ncbi:MAG: helix-turn-helix domain-containing protein [Pyrinomonadaceae bacterium]
MSTILFNTSLNIYSAAYVNHFAVGSQRSENLAEYVRRVRVQVRDFSLSEVERNSGGGIDGSYVSRIENGLVKNVTPEKLKALAKGLEVSEEEIFAVARGKPLDYEDPLDELKVLFHGWDEATDEERASTLDDLKMIAERFQRRRKQRPAENGQGRDKGKK